MKTKIHFTSEDQLVKKVLAGETVHWVNDGYVVTGKTEDSMSVTFIDNKYSTGLFNRSGVLQGKLSDFYFYGDLYTIIVGNVGTVYDGCCGIEAEKIYWDYVQISKSGHGRAGHEQVVLYLNNEPIKEYEGIAD